MLEIRHQNMDDTSATQAAYDEIFSSEGIRHKDSLYIWLINLLHPQPGSLLMDISTGQGRLVTLANQLKLRAIGVDFSIQGLYLGKKDSPESGWVVGDGERLPFADSSVDYITHIGSLEHYMDPYLGAAEVARVLKPDGLACILLPNAFGLWGNIRWVLKTGEIFDDGQPLQRYATRATWQGLLNQGGLEVVRTVRYGLVPIPHTWADFIWLLLHPQKMLSLMVSFFIPVNLANHLVFLCRKNNLNSA